MGNKKTGFWQFQAVSGLSGGLGESFLVLRVQACEELMPLGFPLAAGDLGHLRLGLVQLRPLALAELGTDTVRLECLGSN